MDRKLLLEHIGVEGIHTHDVYRKNTTRIEETPD